MSLENEIGLLGKDLLSLFKSNIHDKTRTHTHTERESVEMISTSESHTPSSLFLLSASRVSAFSRTKSRLLNINLLNIV